MCTCTEITWIKHIDSLLTIWASYGRADDQVPLVSGTDGVPHHVQDVPPNGVDLVHVRPREDVGEVEDVLPSAVVVLPLLPEAGARREPLVSGLPDGKI